MLQSADMAPEIIEVSSDDDDANAARGEISTEDEDPPSPDIWKALFKPASTQQQPETPRAMKSLSQSGNKDKGKSKQATGLSQAPKPEIIDVTNDTSEDEDTTRTVRKPLPPPRRKSTVSPVKKTNHNSMASSPMAGPGPSTLRARAKRDSTVHQKDPNASFRARIGRSRTPPILASDPVNIIPPTPSSSTVVSASSHKASGSGPAKSYPDPYAPIAMLSAESKSAETEGSWLNPVVMAGLSRTPSPTGPTINLPEIPLGSWGNPVPMQIRHGRKRSTDSTPEPVYKAKRTGGKRLKRIISPPPALVIKAEGQGTAQAAIARPPSSEGEAFTPGQMTEASDDPLLLRDEGMDIELASAITFDSMMAGFPTPAPHDDPLDTSPTRRDQEAVESILDSIADVTLTPAGLSSTTIGISTSSSGLVLPGFFDFDGHRRKFEAECRKSSRLPSTPPLATGSSSASEELKPVDLSPVGTGPGPFEVYPDMDMTRDEWRQIVVEHGETDLEVLLERKRSPDPERELIYIDPYDAHAQSLVVEQPPQHLRGEAKRVWNSKTIDEFNHRLPTMTHNPRLHRMIFEDLIAQSELESGGISVVNEVDADPAPPDFEFECSNEILYHPDVPDPELGQGCGCTAPCSPTSKTCTCLKRQEAYSRDVLQTGFAYDDNGLLRHAELPIWECGDTCGCPPDCMNRVIQHGRNRKTAIQLFKTRQKGWGVRAKVSMPRGTFVGIYSGELITDIETERRGELYDEIGRTYLFDCDGYHLAAPPVGLEKFDTRLAETAAASAERARLGKEENHGSQTWCYSAYSVDAFHYGNYTRFFNHSCEPNLCITMAYVRDFHPELPLLVVFTRKAIRQGDEMCISYKGVVSEDEAEEEERPKRSYKKKKGKAKGIAKAHVTAAESLASKKLVKDICRCGTARCNGTMFN